MNLNDVLKKFLKDRLVPNKSLLLALSGGPDSLALFHALLHCRYHFSFELHVAHVDHGWREESVAEAAQLKEMVEREKIPFHLRTLSPELIKGNLEDGCRRLRRQFFKEIVDNHDCQAVLLGHHRDDQAETVLKRLFEGGALTSLSGMSEVVEIEGLVFWRPFLKVSRQEIISWTEQHRLSPFYDETNMDPKFLRGRMRKTLLPTLSQQFGKEVSSSLCRISRQAQELQEHLNQQISPFLGQREKGGMGMFFDFTEQRPESLFVWKHLIRTIANKQGLCLSSPAVDTIVQLLQSGAANRQVCVSGRTIQIDRCRLFFCERLLCGDWTVTVQPFNGGRRPFGNSWKDVWRGSCSVVLPEGEYQLSSPNNHDRWQKTTLDRWWTQHKVPAFLRSSVPVVCNENGVQHEFLSGHTKGNEHEKSENNLIISLKISS